MSKDKFKTYEGTFPCHTCREDVFSVRLWLDTANLTWMCSQKHVTKIPLILTKKDYERKK